MLFLKNKSMEVEVIMLRPHALVSMFIGLFQCMHLIYCGYVWSGMSEANVIL